MSLKVKVSAIGLLDMLKFKNQTEVREKTIEKGAETPLPSSYAANALAEKMHPRAQKMTVCEIIPRADDVKTFVLRTENGQSAAPFSAGQYISFSMEAQGSVFTRPVSLCSSPALARQGIYAVTVKRAGFGSNAMFEQFVPGQTVTVSAPLGNFYHSSLRDANTVLALAGGIGITPFVSMAHAIADGEENFSLTILYGTPTLAQAYFKEELEELCRRSGGKVRFAHVLSAEKRDGCEHGLLSAELIRKYMPDAPCSLFLAGPQAMYRFLDGELAALGLEQKWVRRELFGAAGDPASLPGYPAEHTGKHYTVTLQRENERLTFPAAANEPLLVAIERAAISANSHCRSGECGWCRTRLLRGNVFVPQERDARRAADRLFGYIHPCISYPLSDITLALSNP